jgi:FlaG/FlaF family flagellin (archaellin)
MQIRDLFTDDDAVSSVVSTILMVAITIILVAVIGSFVLNLGGAVSETSPSATFVITETELSKNGSAETAVIISHQGGDVIETDRVDVTVDDETAKTWKNKTVWTGSDTISAGDSAEIMRYGSSNTKLSGGERIVVVWHSAGGDKSYILTRYVVKG